MKFRHAVALAMAAMLFAPACVLLTGTIAAEHDRCISAAVSDSDRLICDNDYQQALNRA